LVQHADRLVEQIKRMPTEDLEQELLALEAIYGDDFYSSDSSHCIITLYPCPGPLSLHLDFPSTYPSIQAPAPIYSITTTWPSPKGGDMLSLSETHRQDIDQEFRKITDSMQGQGVVVFEWVEWLRFFLESHYQQELIETPPIMPVMEEQIDTIEMTTPCTPTLPFITASSPILDRKSVFLGHCAIISSKENVETFKLQLMADKKTGKHYHSFHV
jgi:hypothetical protein